MNTSHYEQTPFMIIPENGSIVIIDDEPEEAFPIIRALSKRGISSTYYKGNVKDDLPDKPTQYIRIAFLDLQLIETSDEHQISKSVVNILKHIIPEENGPYILIVWSKNFAKYGEAVENEIKTIPHLIPATIINFNKRDCLEEKIVSLIDSEDFIKSVLGNIKGVFDEDNEQILSGAIETALSNEFKTTFEAKPNAIEIIEEHIKKELIKAGVFHLFVIWENLAKKSAAKLVKDISGLVPNNDNWETNMRNVFKRMAIARVGRNVIPMDVQIKESINTLNSSFIDSLESEIKKETLPTSITLDSNIITIEKIDGAEYALKKEEHLEFFTKNEDKMVSGETRQGLLKSLDKDKKIVQVDKDICQKLITNYDRIPTSLNTKLHIETTPSQDLIPGNIYLNDNLSPEKKRQYLKTFFKAIPEDISEYILIDLEVSPICDYAQDKWKRSRTLHGIIYPKEKENDLKNGNHYYPVEPVFELEGNICKIAFDFHLFNALDKTIAKEKIVKYRFKREILLDIIAQLSAHVNRPGISFVS